MNIKIEAKNKEAALALMKNLVSKRAAEREDAAITLAEFIGPAIQTVINSAPTVGNLFTSFPFNPSTNPSIPLDLYRDIGEEDFVQVWSQDRAGGLATNEMTAPTEELKFKTYSLDSAISFREEHAQGGRLDVLAKSMTRMAQEFLRKQEVNAAVVMMRALANATTKIKGVNTRHVIRTGKAGELFLNDFNRIFTLLKRIYSSWDGGTPVGGVGSQGRGITDLLISPEVVEFIRGMAYNPINNRAGIVTNGSGGGADGVAVTAITLTDEERRAIYNSAGIPTFYGVNLIEVNELGVGYRYNDLFDAQAGSNTYPAHPITGGSDAVFDGTTEQILVGVDLSKEVFLRPVSSEEGVEVVTLPDDQFLRRSGKVGFYSKLHEGRIIIDDRALVGMIM